MEDTHTHAHKEGGFVCIMRFGKFWPHWEIARWVGGLCFFFGDLGADSC